mgnify:CR=1 FL=1
MDQEQLDYLLQSQYLPSTRDLNIGSMGVTPVLLQGTGLQTGTMGANPQLMTDDSLQVGSMGANPQLMTDQFLQLGSMGANPFRGIQTVFRPNTLPALSDLGGMTPNFGVAEEEDVEQVEYLGSEPSGIAKLLQYLPFVGDKSLSAGLLKGFIPQQDPRAINMRNFYGSQYGLTPTGSLASGIMAGYNPISGGFLNTITGGKFGRPTNYGLATAARERINRIANRKAAQTAASRARIAELQKFARADEISRARQANPGVYAAAEKQGFIDSRTGGFKSAGTNEAFSNRTGRGRTGY